MSVVKSKLSEWANWLVSYVLASIREPVGSAFSRMRSSITRLYSGAGGTLQGEVEQEAEEEHNEEEVEGITPVEHKQAMNGAYRSFRVAGQEKTDVDSYIALVKKGVRCSYICG